MFHHNLVGCVIGFNGCVCACVCVCVCAPQELGFSYVEMNASCTRSKNSLKDVVAESLNNTSIENFYKGETQLLFLLFPRIIAIHHYDVVKT